MQKLILSGAGTETEQLNELARPVKLVFNIPPGLLQVPGGMSRTFSMLRIHGGTAELLTDEDNDPGTYTITSDGFSLYTLANQDTRGSAGGGSFSPTYSIQTWVDAERGNDRTAAWAAVCWRPRGTPPGRRPPRSSCASVLL